MSEIKMELGSSDLEPSPGEIPAPAAVSSTALTPSEPVVSSPLAATPDETGSDKTMQKTRKGIMNLTKSDLVRLLGVLEAELQARDLAITSLKAERTKVLRPPCNNQRYTLANPYAALGRDDGDECGSSVKDPTKINANNDPVACLQALVEQHKKAEQNMRAQMERLRASHDMTLKQLDLEKRKHAQDTAQGDDVTYLLEKERERLAQQLDFEKSQQKKLEKETRRNQTTLAQERKKQLQFAKAVMDERKLLLLELNETKQRAEELERFMLSERAKLRDASRVVAYERKRSVTMEAEMERQLSEFDIEREQLSAKLNREENRTRELRGEVAAAVKRLEELEKAGTGGGPSSSTRVAATKVQTNGPVNSKQGTGSPRTVNGIREARDRLTKPSRSPMPSVKPSKIYTVKGFQSPRAATVEKSDKSESSSSGSEELPSPLSPNSGLPKSIAVPISTAGGTKPKPSGSKPSLTGKHSVEFESVGTKSKSSPRSSPSPGTGLHRANSGRTLGSASSLDKLTRTGKSSLSPASSLDRLTKSASLDKLSKSSSLDKLSKIGSESPPTQKSSKIPSSISGSTSAFQRGSSASPNRKSFNGGDRSSSEPGKLNRINSPSTPLNSLSQKSNMNSGGSGSTNGLSRPTALSNSKSDSTRSSFRKIPAPGWPLSNSSPSTSPTKPMGGTSKGSGWRKTPTSTNSNTTQGSKASSPPPPSQAKISPPSTNGLTPHGKGSPASTTPSPQSNGQIPKKPISPRGGTTSITRLPAPSVTVSDSPLHQAARQGDTATICRLIEEQHSPNSLENDGSTPVHTAAEAGQLDCLDLLLDLGGDFDAKRTDGFTCVHGAAAEGQDRCLASLLDRGANPNVSDSLGWTPLHLAASYGHVQCIRILLNHKANRNCYSKTGWSALHSAVRHNQTKCLNMLLVHKPTNETNQPLITDIDNNTSQSDNRMVSADLLNAQDQDGWTIAHVVASKGLKDCLETLCRYGGLDLDIHDKCRRTAYDVATDTCKEFLNTIEGKKVRIIIDVSTSSSNYNKPPSPGGNQKDAQHKQFVVGRVVISPGMSWPDFDNAVATVLTSHSRDIEGCPKDDTSDSDSDSRCSSDDGSEVGHELGLGANSIHCYLAGNLQWNVGENPKMSPCDLFNLTSEITVRLRGLTECSLDQLAYDSLIPTHTLQNYVRLIEQYKSVVFYGPPGSGKSHVSSKIAEFIRIKLHQSGCQSSVTYVSLHNKFTKQELAKLLCNEGFYLPVVSEPDGHQPINSIPILVLDDISKVPITTVLCELMEGLEHRGPQHPQQLSDLPGSYYLHGDCIVIATMDKSSSGMDLSVQQRFRWIRLHWDREPVQSMLSRHLVRRLISKLDGRLPPSDDPTYRAVEWVCTVWHRLNDCFLRLPLPGTVLGPKHFFTCPIDVDTPKSIMRWLCLLWNHAIAPSVEDTLRKTANKSKTTSEQNTEKLTITALYVLLQRAVFPGCPLSSEDLQDYLSSFHGFAEPNTAELTPQRLNSLRRSQRRSKSLDRSKTSNKVKALMVKQQQQQQQSEALDLITTTNNDTDDPTRSSRSMIPRRVAVSSSSTVKTKSKLPQGVTNSPQSDANSNHTDSILTAAEEEDLLESLLSLQGSQSDSEIDRLIELQDRLFGGSPIKNKKGGMKGSLSNGNSPKRKRDANEVGKPVKRPNGDEEGVWEVWEETV